MAKEPSLDFIKSISKFKKNSKNKKTGLSNDKIRIKMLDDFLITKKELETNHYKNLLKEEEQVERNTQINYRISRYKFFLSSLPEEIIIPNTLLDLSSIYHYFILFRRKNKEVTTITDTPTELELEIATKILDNFYLEKEPMINKNSVLIKRISFYE